MPGFWERRALKLEDSQYRKKNGDDESKRRLWTKAAATISETSRLHAIDDPLHAAMGRG